MIPDPGAPEPLLDQAAHGYRATLLSQAIRVACKAASVVIMARVVSPADHGRFAMAASVTLLLVLFRDLGLGAAAVQAKHLSEEQKTTLWHAHAALGIVLAAVTLSLGPVAASFYREPSLTRLLAAMSAGMLIIGVNAWPRVLLLREMRIAELNRVETLATAVGTAAMVTAGVLGGGAFSFAVFLIVSEAVALVEGWRICRWRPAGRGNWSSLGGLLHVGANLTGYNVLIYFLQQMDTLLMGRWFGPSALGYYSRPGQLLYLPTLHIAGPLTQVMTSSLSRLGTASPSFARHVRETANLIAHVTLPFAVACAVLNEETVRLILGPAWPEAAPLLRWLAVSAAATYLTATVYGLCVSTGHSRRLAAMSAFALPATLLGLWLGRAHGPAGLAAGLAAANLALLLPRLWWAAQGTPVKIGDFAAAYLGPLTASAVMAAAMAAARVPLSPAHWAVRLIASIAAGCMAVAVLALAWRRLRNEYRHVWNHMPRSARTRKSV